MLVWLWPSRGSDAGFSPHNQCYEGFHDWEHLWSEEKKAYCCDTYGRGCVDHAAQTEVVYHKVPVPVHEPSRIVHVPVPMRPETHVVYKTHYVHSPPEIVWKEHHRFHYDCHEGYSNWFFGWSAHKKSWCCDHMTMGCPGTWHGSYHLHTHVFAKGVGHAHGRIYDCNAGFSNWMQGWSGSKKDWCCSKHNKGCVKFHCSSGAVPWLQWVFKIHQSLLSWIMTHHDYHVTKCIQVEFNDVQWSWSISADVLGQAHMWAAEKRSWCPGSESKL